jgi:GT2 family glycosyltransferase
MDHDDLLPEHALVYVAREIVEQPDLDLIYSDEDKVDGRGRRYEPHFKPDWNQELFLTLNFVSHLGVFRTDLLRRIGGFRVGLEGSQDHDLVLRCLAHTDETRIRHIPRILYHWRNYRRSHSFSEKQIDKAVVARRKALADFAASQGWNAEVVDGPIGANRLRRRLPERPPEVTVVVPTRDGADLLATCARGVLSETNYDPLRLIILDNESREPATQHLFRDLARDSRVTIMPVPGPFNFSAMNNAAVRASSSDLVLFLNNDIEVVDQEWLSEMVGLAVSDGVAAVGAKLLYPDSRVQHGGIILGAGGIAGHAHLFSGALDPGYFGRAVLPQYLSAVTAACMLVRREAFLEVGGFDEEALTVAFNDVDLCLKLRARGHKIAWTPYATLIHHESASRGLDLAPAKRARFESETKTMLERWGHVLRRDPYYNPNLSLELAQFKLKGVDPASLQGRRRGFLR